MTENIVQFESGNYAAFYCTKCLETRRMPMSVIFEAPVEQGGPW